MARHLLAVHIINALKCKDRRCVRQEEAETETVWNVGRYYNETINYIFFIGGGENTRHPAQGTQPATCQIACSARNINNNNNEYADRSRQFCALFSQYYYYYFLYSNTSFCFCWKIVYHSLPPLSIQYLPNLWMCTMCMDGYWVCCE